MSAEQVEAFERAGHLVLRGFFGDVVTQLERSYEDLDIEREGLVVRCDAFYDTRRTGREEPRLRIGQLQHAPGFAWLHDDQRCLTVARQLLGRETVLRESDASMFRCDTHWHDDSPVVGGQGHVLFFAYLDHLDATNGALRVIPGSHRAGSFRDERRASLVGGAMLGRPPDVERPDEVPCQVLDVEPGDVIALHSSTLHASFGGSDRRRVVNLCFGPPGGGPAIRWGG